MFLSAKLLEKKQILNILGLIGSQMDDFLTQTATMHVRSGQHGVECSLAGKH